MNEHTVYVETPKEWKENLTLAIQKKPTSYRKTAILLTAILLVLIISGTAFAARVINAPEYFGTMFLGTGQAANEVYSVKNTAFESSRNDLQLTNVGIVGDGGSVRIRMLLTSTGDITFDEDKFYLFGSSEEKALLLFESYSSSTSFYVVDNRTLEIFYILNGIEGNNLVGRTMRIELENIEVYNDDLNEKPSIIECNFKGKVKIDYANTTVKLNSSKNAFLLNETTVQAEKGTISNLHLSMKVRINENADKVNGNALEKLVKGTLTLHYSDGTSEDFNLSMPPKNENDVFASSLGKSGDNLELKLCFRKPIISSNVIAVSIGGVEVFTAK